MPEGGGGGGGSSSVPSPACSTWPTESDRGGQAGRRAGGCRGRCYQLLLLACLLLLGARHNAEQQPPPPPRPSYCKQASTVAPLGCKVSRDSPPPLALRYLHHDGQTQRLLGDILPAVLARSPAALGILDAVQLLRRLRHRHATPRHPLQRKPRAEPPSEGSEQEAAAAAGAARLTARCLRSQPASLPPPGAVRRAIDPQPRPADVLLFLSAIDPFSCPGEGVDPSHPRAARLRRGGECARAGKGGCT